MPTRRMKPHQFYTLWLSSIVELSRASPHITANVVKVPKLFQQERENSAVRVVTSSATTHFCSREKKDKSTSGAAGKWRSRHLNEMENWKCIWSEIISLTRRCSCQHCLIFFHSLSTFFVVRLHSKLIKFSFESPKKPLDDSRICGCQRETFSSLREEEKNSISIFKFTRCSRFSQWCLKVES